MKPIRPLHVVWPAAIALFGALVACNLTQGGALRPPRSARGTSLAATIQAMVTQELSATDTGPDATPTPAIAPLPETPGPDPLGRIVYTCFDGSYDQICTIRADGSDPRQLTNAPATDFYASFSPDGTEIVFSSRRNGRFEIYSIPSSGGPPTRLTDSIGSGLYAPEIAPDGSTIVFTNDRDGVQSIWLMDRDGGNPRALTDENGSDIDPTWSPDGLQIAFSSSRAGDRQIFIMNVDGSGMRRLSERPDMGGRLSWSPDGSLIAFYAGPQLSREVYTIEVATGVLRQLTDGGDNLAPHFSPDGLWLTFTSYRDGDNEIYIMRSDGSDVRQVTHNLGSDWQPRWGPP